MYKINLKIKEKIAEELSCEMPPCSCCDLLYLVRISMVHGWCEVFVIFFFSFVVSNKDLSTLSRLALTGEGGGVRAGR